jgi:phosphoglycerate dehydrogenase-like enzyme
MQVHLENLSAKPSPFWLTPDLVQRTRARHPAETAGVDFTVGTDLLDVEARLATTRVLVTSSGFVHHPAFPAAGLAVAAPRLELLHLIDAGVEDVMPLDWLPPGVTLTNNSGVHAAKAREFLLMALLALNARLPTIARNQHHAQWDQPFTPVIRGKALLVVGLGDLGQAAVAAGHTLGMRVAGVRRSGLAMAGVEVVHRPEHLEQAVRDADFIVIATPLTPDTRGLVSRAVLQATRRGTGIINIGRAEVLDHAALVDLLRSGHLGGALLDVLPEEPLPASSALWSCPDLMIVPHVGADDPLTYLDETMRLVCSNVGRLARGEPLVNVVDRLRQY